MPVYPFRRNAAPFRAAPAASPQMRAGILLRSLCSRAEWRGHSGQKKAPDVFRPAPGMFR